MADFPSKVTTETSSPNSQSSQQGGNIQGLAVNVSFIRSIPAVLMIVEIFLGLLHWALIASAPHQVFEAYGWVLFVAITLWILTIILFLMTLLSVQQSFTSVPWPLTVMVYHIAATVFYLSAFLANATHVRQYRIFYFYGHFAAAAFFGAAVTLAYGVSAYFSWLNWKGNRENTATNTAPI